MQRQRIMGVSTRDGEGSGVEWSDLRHVAAVAEAGSVRRAGDLLGIHGATVARHVERLESQLGVKLFARTRGGMVPTELGQRALEVYRQVAQALEGLERELRAAGAALAGPVTLYVSEALAAGWLIPRLRAFTDKYPEIQLTVRTIDSLPALAPGAAHAALALTAEPPGHLVGRRLGTVAVCGYRARGAAGAVRSTELLIGPPLPQFERVWQESGRAPQAQTAVHCPALLAQLEACRSGMGAAVLPCVLGDAFRGLERVSPSEPIAAGDVWLLSHPDSRGIARLQALIGYVQEAWTADRTRLEGRAGAETSTTDA
jgi:DNA-binding transcriptional LysR family regulator